MQVQLLSQFDKQKKREQYAMWMEALYEKKKKKKKNEGEMLAEHFSIAFSISRDFYGYDA